jgi:hypothetical protein
VGAPLPPGQASLTLLRVPASDHDLGIGRWMTSGANGVAAMITPLTRASAEAPNQA